MKAERTAEQVKAEAAQVTGAMSNQSLFRCWEITEKANHPDIPTIRGWLMDEIERRFPETFEQWLDGDAEDSELKTYCLG